MRLIRNWRTELRIGALSRRRRWQLVAGVVAFYLVRDLLLYVVLPAMLWFKTR